MIWRFAREHTCAAQVILASLRSDKRFYPDSPDFLSKRFDKLIKDEGIGEPETSLLRMMHMWAENVCGASIRSDREMAEDVQAFVANPLHDCDITETWSGFLCLASSKVQPHDRIILISGNSPIIVLRDAGIGRYQFLGTVLTHGGMRRSLPRACDLELTKLKPGPFVLL